MKVSKLLALILALGWFLGLAGNLQAALRYRYYTTGQGNGSEARAINDNGQAVVNFNDRAYLWTLDGGLTDLGDLGGGISEGYGINNQGQIVGSSYINSTEMHAFLWQSGTMQDLGGLSGGVENAAGSINNLGKVLGATIFPDDSSAYFTWTQSGGIQPLDLQGGDPIKISDNDSIVGMKNDHPWLWTSPGAGQDLGMLPGGTSGIATDINQNGQVVGFVVTDLNFHAFSWTQSGGIQDLGTLGGDNGLALAINNQGYIVGGAATPARYLGCMWTPEGAKLNLDTLVINKPAGEGIGDAYDINANGIIVGWGNAGGPAYMLVPENINLSPGVLLPLME